MKARDTGGSGFSLENRYGRMPIELFKVRAMQSLPKYVRGVVLVEDSRGYMLKISV